MINNDNSVIQADGQAHPPLWSCQADRWRHVGAPTRPTQEDGRLMTDLAKPFLSGAPSSLKVAVLGVTPEVVNLPWVRHAHLCAFDRNLSMIQQFWRHDNGLCSHVIQADWGALPVSANSLDLVVGDGCLTALNGLQQARVIMDELSRVLKPSGGIVMRCFIRPIETESLQEIVDETLQGNIQFFGSLKWRFAMALTDPASSTVQPALVHETFNKHFPDRNALQQKTGWDRQTIDTIDAYSDIHTLFTFPTKAEMKELCVPFRFVGEREGSYELAERCPTLALTSS